jgi:hydroxymethylbilane synthase
VSGSRTLRIGSRGSELALWQARHVQSLLRARFVEEDFPIEIIRTSGDRIQDRALYKVEDKGFFTKEIEEALLSGRIDLAVHSLKDLPTESPAGLTVAAVPEREDAHDVWLSLDGSGPLKAAPNARVATSSLRRRAQLRALRPDLTYEDLRGNVPTRVQKLRDGLYDAVVLARAGLYRLGLLPENAVVLPFEAVLPAPGQGALGIQTRSDDLAARSRAAVLQDDDALWAVTAERAFLGRLQGGCLVPVGAHAVVRGDRLCLAGMVADLSGAPIFRGEEERVLVGSSVGSAVTLENGARGAGLHEATALGISLADRLLAEGAGPVLEAVREYLRREVGSGGSVARPAAPADRGEGPDQPLRGRNILLTREEEGGGGLAALLTASGAVVRNLPFTRTEPPQDREPLLRVVRDLPAYDYVVLTSPRAVKALADLDLVLDDGSTDSRPRWACVGPATASALRRLIGIEADLVPRQFDAANLSLAITRLEVPRMAAPSGRGLRVLFPAAENAGSDLPESLRRAGMEVTRVTAYRTVPALPAPEELLPPGEAAHWDAVVFTSGLVVQLFLDLLYAQMDHPAAVSWLEANHPAVLGRTAAEALRSAGVRSVRRAPRPTTEDLAATLVTALTRRDRRN